MTGWLAAKAGRYEEQVASFSLVGLLVIGLAGGDAEFRPSRFWLVVTLGFGLLALGPFIHVAGVNTYIPTPWTLLRYVPLLRRGADAVTIRGRGDPGLLRAPVRSGARRAHAAAYPAAPAADSRRGRLRARHSSSCRCRARCTRPTIPCDLPDDRGRSASGPRARSAVRHAGRAVVDRRLQRRRAVLPDVHGKRLVGGYLSRVSDAAKRRYLPAPTRAERPDRAQRKAARSTARGADRRAPAAPALPRRKHASATSSSTRSRVDAAAPRLRHRRSSTCERSKPPAASSCTSRTP